MNALTLRWDETQPTDDPRPVAACEQSLAAAQAAGITVELDLYPLHSQAFTSGRLRAVDDPRPAATRADPAVRAWAASVAQTFPTVHQFIVMNECNQPLFVNPQWDAAGQNQSAAICGARARRGLRRAQGASARRTSSGASASRRAATTTPNAASNSSTSPVNFLGALGAWFKAFAARPTARRR